VVLLQHSLDFYTAPHCWAHCLVAWLTHSINGGLIMIMDDLTLGKQRKAIKAAFATNDVRTLIANHLGVSVHRVTDDAHFTDHLGADWLDRLNLMISVEDQFAGLEITDDDVDRIQAVGDLIRHVEALDIKRRRRAATPESHNLLSPHVAYAEKPAKQQQSCDEAALVVSRLAGDATRSLIGWCRETRQQVDLRLYVDDATLARIWSNVLRFQCPHCGSKHETEVQRVASKPFSLEAPQTKRKRHQDTA